MLFRANALGVSSMASRWGSISSPYLIFLQDYVSWLPFTIFGAVALLAAFLTLFLPETKGVEMMQTMEEAEEFYTRSNKFEINLPSRSGYQRLRSEEISDCDNLTWDFVFLNFFFESKCERCVLISAKNKLI